jgi:hypothetical protein
MATYARYYEDDSADVEYTNYIDIKVTDITHTIERDVEVVKGNAGSNTYRDDQRYTQTWKVQGQITRRAQDCLRTWATNVFDGDTALRVYDEYSASYYTDYTSVKLKSCSMSPTDSTGTLYNVTLVVVK